VGYIFASTLVFRMVGGDGGSGSIGSGEGGDRQNFQRG
jgi:hypothetical protein